MNVFAKIFNRFFSAERLIKPDRVLGELPNTKKLYGEYLKIAWPSMLETVLTSLTGFVDTMMVGTLTSSAITAVGLTSQPRLLIFSLFFSINAGITAVVSRKKGEGDRDGANAAMHTGLLMTLACVVAAFTFAFTCCDPLLKFAGATGENAAILPLSRTYFLIVIVGLCINAFGMTINAAQRACSNTRITFITSMIANGVNVVFNYLLIGGHFGFPALGVAGAAIATTFGNVCACAVSIFSVCRKNSYLKLRIKHFKAVSLKYAVMVGKVFSGAGLEQLFLRFGMFMFAKEVAELGTQEFATHQICMTIVTISFAFGDGLGVAASALVGQNLGKKRPDLSEVYAKAARNVGFAFSVILFSIFILGRSFLVDLFTNEAEIIEVGSKIMFIVAVVSLMQIIQTIYTGCLRGAGDTHYTAVVSFFSIALLRPILARVFCYTLGFGVIGAWFSLFIDQLIRFVASNLRFAGGKWKTIKLG